MVMHGTCVPRRNPVGQGKGSSLLLCSLPAQPDVTVVNKFIPFSTDSRGGLSSVPFDAEVTGIFKGIAGGLGVWEVSVKKWVRGLVRVSVARQAM